MFDEAPSAAADSRPASERPSASLLVRCWLEPRERSGEPPILRGYVKNLKTGEETYIADLDAVGLQIRRSLGPDVAGESAPAVIASREQRSER
jgi:hypothetical protein